jgi:hypothetical protein
MNQLLHEHPKNFSTRKVSVDQAVKLLRRNGVRVNKESVEIILDFLYCIAKTYNMQKGHANRLGIEPQE